MKRNGEPSKSETIRALLVRPMTLDDLLPKMEERLQMVVGRARLLKLLGVMQVHGNITSTGRGRERVYVAAKG